MSRIISHTSGFSTRRTTRASDFDLSARGVVTTIGMAFDTLFDWMERYQQRRALAAMSDHLLKDIGMSRADAEREIEKPFWKV